MAKIASISADLYLRYLKREKEMQAQIRALLRESGQIGHKIKFPRPMSRKKFETTVKNMPTKTRAAFVRDLRTPFGKIMAESLLRAQKAQQAYWKSPRVQKRVERELEALIGKAI